ncbi:lipoprotein-releasing ABC transporter ATP-binding protein LolD [Aliikangiella marina]|uniref:Lipoprotein-releasing system ATP-binding protein LolD n=1 Tax=Aliikangiella marina TaxID=1712262 RepID=A0A545TIU2_9GAMM|nr:lipoprotein-releasing ABC transporter ATP-binding protein LolD [Aliikangiella marina]TQV77142.1 lipoprotein-releasing ABC transporter ATP-binding protein LolD [Aliikangiella marina]
MSNQSENVLVARNVSKTFVDGANKIEVLKRVDIEIAKAEMVAIIGASGSGKSTLLHVLGGLDQPDEGEVIIKGKDIHKASVRQQGEIRNKYLGFVYQFHHLLAEFTALENVAMPLLIGGIPQNDAYEKAEAMIGKVGLAQRLTHRPAKLSGGERQRIAIARAMVTNPACILADEPTGNLDMGTAQAINELMFELNQSEETSFLVVSHDLRLAQSMQKTYEMTDGELSLASTK